MPIAPTTPLSYDHSHGPYGASEKMKEMAFQNLKVLALTNPGERFGHPNFGIGLRNKLFEQDTPALRVELQARIKNQIARYCPYVRLLGVQFSPQDDANPTLEIDIIYIVMAGTSGSEKQVIGIKTVTGITGPVPGAVKIIPSGGPFPGASI